MMRNNTIKLFATALPVVFLAMVSIGQQPVHVSLDEAVALAVQHNHQLKLKRLDVEISQKKMKESLAIGLPQVSGEATYNNYIDIPTQVAEASAFDPTAPPGILVPLRFGLPHSMTAGINASQLVFNASYLVALKAASEYVKASEYELEKTEIEIKTSVSQTYFSIVAANKSIEALKENQVNMDKMAFESQRMFEAGFMEQQDAEQMQLLKSNTKNQLDYTIRQRDYLEDVLKMMVGMNISDSIVLTDDLESLLLKQTEGGGEILSARLQPDEHIDMISLRQGIRLQELALANERASNYPQLNAFFTHSQNAFRKEFDFFNGGNWYPTTIWGFQLRVPIFKSLQGYQRISQAKLELAKMQVQEDLLEKNLNVQVNQAKSNYKSALDRYELVEKDLELATRIKNTTRSKFNQGLASSSDLTSAENQYLTTLSNYINTTLELLNAKLELNKALGNN
ncbi:MAG: hypothetical protein Kow0075_13990 [Salibacteraceae bacterium]